MAPDDTALTSKISSGSPYQLDPAQVLKASTALLKHIKSEIQRKEATARTKNLLADPDDSSSDAAPSTVEPIWLVLTTKRHVVDKARLKPGKIPLPHSLYTSSSTNICLITADPQRTFKDVVAHPSFPASLVPRITRIIGISKLKARYKSFESRRQLLAEHDIFLADDRIVTFLPNVLGKTFYKGSKRPVPVGLQPPKTQEQRKAKIPAVPLKTKKPSGSTDSAAKTVATPLQVGNEISRALTSAQVHLAPAVTTAIRVGLTSFKAEQLAKNIEAVVRGMIDKFIPKGWRNIRSIHIKGPNSTALPIWLANELWLDEVDILENHEEAKAVAAKKRERRNKPKSKLLTNQGDKVEENDPKVANDDGFSAEMRERREKLRAQKLQIRDKVEGKKRKHDEDEQDVTRKKAKPKKQEKRKSEASVGEVLE